MTDDQKKRIEAATDYIDNAEWLSADNGEGGSSSGYYYDDVMKAIHIAAGVSQQEKPKEEAKGIRLGGLLQHIELTDNFGWRFRTANAYPKEV